ncbi:MAG: hypothetical protein ACE1ZT_00910, partial [Dehalococcoidia bacterium]
PALGQRRANGVRIGGNYSLPVELLESVAADEAGGVSLQAIEVSKELKGKKNSAPAKILSIIG